MSYKFAYCLSLLLALLAPCEGGTQIKVINNYKKEVT